MKNGSRNIVSKLIFLSRLPIVWYSQIPTWYMSIWWANPSLCYIVLKLLLSWWTNEVVSIAIDPISISLESTIHSTLTWLRIRLIRIIRSGWRLISIMSMGRLGFRKHRKMIKKAFSISNCVQDRPRQESLAPALVKNIVGKPTDWEHHLVRYFS